MDKIYTIISINNSERETYVNFHGAYDGLEKAKSVMEEIWKNLKWEEPQIKEELCWKGGLGDLGGEGWCSYKLEIEERNMNEDWFAEDKKRYGWE